MAVMLQSRVPVVKALKGLASQEQKQAFKEKILKVSQLVEEGNSLSEAFSEFPETFSVFYINLIKTGEASGKISDSLIFLSEHLEREDEISSQVKGAMIYPAFVIAVLAVVVSIVTFVVMPRLIDLINQTLTKPPFMTMLMINFYNFLISYGWILIIVFLACASFFAYYLKTIPGKKFIDKLSLELPFIKEFFKKINLTRFAENTSTLISAGLSVNVALKITKKTIDSFIYRDIITKIEDGVGRGERISRVMEKHPDYVTPFVIQMTQVGEETGHLDKNLMEIVKFYQKEIKRHIDTFISLLEPMLIIFLGIAVALLAVTVLSPLYSTLGTI
jgi:type IV pilus assembly protein PilC